MAQFVQAARRDPLRGYRFRVTDLTGEFQFGGFSMVSGLRSETEVVNYREGEDGAVMRKLPGLTEFDNVILEKGMSTNDALQQWRNKVYAVRKDNTLPPDSEFRKDLRIILLSRDGSVEKQWKVLEAWPPILEIDELNANTSDVLLERVELANEGVFEETRSPFLAA